MAHVLGLTGTFGCGKSTVAALIAEESGAAVIDADRIAREALEPGGAAFAAVVEAFGPAILGPAGRIDRPALAARVFADRAELARLNALVHPPVRAAELALLEAWKDRPLVVLDVPLLFEAGMRSLADSVAVVVIGERQRYGRLKGRGFREAEVTRRLGMQMAQARKRRLADHIIDNSGPLDGTRQHVRELIETIKGVKAEKR